ncbi:MAG: beta-ketoacyl-ACP synthase 3 [Cyanobacteria bacterium P01_H01_bin.121]
MKQVEVGVAITGSGSAAPLSVMTNDDLAQLVDTNDEWIRTRTGIRERRLASATTSLTDLASQAGQQALQHSGLRAQDVDLIILATSTADDLFGSASVVQTALGATNAVAFDLTAACSGFLFGLVTATQFIRTGAYRNVLLIGADVLSRWVDWSDRRTCILFGDAAGAMVLQAQSGSDDVLGYEIRSNGSQNNCLNLAYQAQAKNLKRYGPEGNAQDVEIGQGQYQPITMNGQEVYRFAVKRVPEVIEKALFRANLTADQIQWLLLHQANQRILDAVAQRLGVPQAKVLSNLAQYGNTSAASIPLAFDEALKAGKIQPGDIIASSGFGAGLTWGAAIFRWHGPLHQA